MTATYSHARAENPPPGGVYTGEMHAGELSALIDAQMSSLVLYARQFCNCPEDVVQTAFGKLAVLSKSPDNPRAWLYTAVRRLALDTQRMDRRRKAREHRAAKPDLWFGETGEGDDAAVALQSLPEEQREVIVMRLWGELTLEEIAAACGCSVSSAYRRYEAGIAAIRERLNPQ